MTAKSSIDLSSDVGERLGAADRHRRGQLRTGDGLRFRWAAVDAVRRALADQPERSAIVAGSLS